MTGNQPVIFYFKKKLLTVEMLLHTGKKVKQQ